MLREAEQRLHVAEKVKKDSGNLKVCCQCRRPGLDPRVGKIPWRREWLPTPVFLPGHPMDRGAWQTIQFMGSQRIGRDFATNIFSFLEV